MCTCAHPSKKIHYHEWISLKRKAESSNKSVKLLQEIYPNAKLDDLEVLASLNTKKDIIQLAKDAGWDDKKINDFKL
jgi:desulfoferrodoxin (superoxide reductase-like protein)